MLLSKLCGLMHTMLSPGLTLGRHALSSSPLLQLLMSFDKAVVNKLLLCSCKLPYMHTCGIKLWTMSMERQLYLCEGEQELAKQAFDRARSADATLALPWSGMALVHSMRGR
jgi:hypothetical protein